MDRTENVYSRIAGNVKKERKCRSITQMELAEKAELSLDTIKNVENGRRAMSLDTYLRIVHALDVSPLVLLGRKNKEEYIDRFLFMVRKRSKEEIEFALHMLEQVFKGQDSYLKE